MVYFRRAVKKRPASLTEEEWLSLRSAGEAFFPESGFMADRFPSPTLDRTILCFWCRGSHLASEVEACMAVPEKRDKGVTPTSFTLSAGRGKMLEQFPELWGFLTAPVTPSGQPRPPGKVSLCLESTGFRMTLTDDHSGQYASFQAPSWDDCMLAFEVALSEGNVPWRASSYAKGKR